MSEIVPRFTTSGDYTPIVDMVAVTPSDSVDLQYNGAAQPPRALWINGAGNIVIDIGQSTSITLTIPATATGMLIFIKPKRIRATSTTATGIFACY